MAFGQGDSRKVPEENEQIRRQLTAHVETITTEAVDEADAANGAARNRGKREAND